MAAPTIEALHHALDAYPDHATVGERLGPAARMVCDDARVSELRVEQMLGALTAEWTTIVEAHRVPQGMARTELTGRFITLCINAFYASQRAPLADGPPEREGARRQA